MKDDRTMESALMRHLYEVEFPYTSTLANVDATRCYQLLSYRQPVTVDHFKLAVQRQSNYFINHKQCIITETLLKKTECNFIVNLHS